MITKEIIQKNINNYIRLNGFGIIEGIKFTPVKMLFYKIIGIDDTGLILKGFRARKTYCLPEHHWKQDYEIITRNEYKKLPAYQEGKTMKKVTYKILKKGRVWFEGENDKRQKAQIEINDVSKDFVVGNDYTLDICRKYLTI